MRLLLLSFLALATASCASRRHLWPNAGQSVQEATSRQASPRPSGAPEAVGLDPDEARIVHENYRMSLTRAKSKPPPPSIIMVEEGRAHPAPQK